MERKSALSPSIYLILASFFWAIGTVLSKELLGSVSPILFLVIQLVPSVLLLWLLVLAKKVPLVSSGGLLPIILLGLLNPGLSYTLSMLGLARTTASVATLVWAAEPAFIVAMAWLLLRETVTASLVFLTLTAALGVVLASGSTSWQSMASEHGIGAGLILSGVACCALYTVLSRKLLTQYEPLSIVAIQQTAGLVWALAIWPLELQGDAVKTVISLSKTELLGGMISGLMYYAIAFWLYLNGLRSMAASKAGNFLNLIPVFGVAAAFIFLDERLTSIQWFGAAIILLSVFVLQRRTALSGLRHAGRRSL